MASEYHGVGVRCQIVLRRRRGKEWRRQSFAECEEPTGRNGCACSDLRDEDSVAAASLPRVKEVIRRVKLSEAQELAAATLHANRSSDVLAMLNALLQRVDPDLAG